MKRAFFIISLVLLAAGCSQSPANTATSNNINQTQNSGNPAATTTMTNQTQTQAPTTPDLMAIVQVMDYGYMTKITVNGQDIGWKGPGGGGVRLFNKENSTYAPKVPPQIMKQNGVLLLGKNTISVTYQKTDPAGTDTLSVEFKMQGYSDDLFNLQAQDAGGTVEQVIDVEPTPPADFKPITITK